MSNPGGKANKVTVFVLNTLFFIVGIFVILAYSAQSFFSFAINVKVTKQQIIDLIPADQYSELDIENIVSDVTIENVTINLPANTLLSVVPRTIRGITKNTPVDVTEEVNEIVNEPINTIVDALHGALRNVIVGAAKQVAIQETKNALVDAIKLGSDKTTEEIEQILESHNYNDEFFENELAGITEMLEDPSGKVSVNEFTNEVVEISS